MVLIADACQRLGVDRAAWWLSFPELADMAILARSEALKQINPTWSRTRCIEQARDECEVSADSFRKREWRRRQARGISGWNPGAHAA